MRQEKIINGYKCFKDLIFLSRYKSYYQTEKPEECEICGRNKILWNIDIEDEVLMLCSECANGFVEF